MQIFQEYPGHEGMMKFIISALFAAAYFALGKLGTSAYAWQAVSDPNTWINSFVTTAMLYCTFDAFTEVFLKRYKNAKPFLAILSFAISTILSSVRTFSLNSEITPIKEGVICLLFFFDFLSVIVLELLGFNYGYLKHENEIVQTGKNYQRVLNILPDAELDAFISEYNRIVSNPEFFAELMPGARYDLYVQLLKDALQERERRRNNKNCQFGNQKNGH